MQLFGRIFRRIAGPMPVAASLLIVAGAAGQISGAQATTAAMPHTIQAGALNHPAAAQDTSSGLRAGSLTAEHLKDPLGIDTSRPRLGWVITSTARGTTQQAYQVRVAPTQPDLRAGTNLTWDSGMVRSARSFDVPYGGPALQSTTRYYWQVRVWDNHGSVSPWSQPAWFETAFLDPSQFQGSWIGQYPDSQQQNAAQGELLFRKQFSLTGQVARARLYAVGLSYPYIYINGRAVSNHMLDTAFTTFNKTVDYTTYDVTSLLQQNANAVAVSLGHGFYAGGADDYPSSGEPWQPAQPKLKLELDVWYADGHSAQVLSDGSWKVTTGPTTADSPAAETYDARLEKPGWTQAGYNDSTWSSASVVSAPAGVLRAQLIPPVLETATLKPVAVTTPKPDTKVYDFGTITSGWSRIAMQGTAGTKVYIEYSEKLNPDGTVQMEGNGSTGQTDVYTLKGGGPETYEPKYGWKGYRYIEVTTTKPTGGLPPVPPSAFPNGLSGQFYNNMALSGSPVLTRNDPNIDFNWNGQSPGTGVNADQWSAKWTGTINPPSTGSYTFSLTSDDGSRLFINGQQVISMWQDQAATTKTATVNLTAGQPASIEVDYYQNGGGSSLSLGWEPPGPSAVPLPQINSVTGVIAHTALPTGGGFHSSSDLLNRMHVAMRNTILNNQYSYGSDTPVYEKGGWTNDNGDYATSEMANFNAEAYYDHMMQNFDDTQDVNAANGGGAGDIGWLVPLAGHNQAGQTDPLWGGSYLLIEYDMFQSYDDLATISRDYSHMAAYMDYMANQIASTGYIYMETTWGDWSVPSNATPPSSQMIGSMFLYREARDLATMAAAIGNTAGASKYNQLADTIETAVNNKFYDPAYHQYYDPPGTVSQARGGPNGPTGCTPGGSAPCGYDQTANVLGLAFGLAPAQDRQAIADGLAADVVAKGNHLATGANGSKYILPMLTEAGYGDLAYKVATNPTAPGWGQWFVQCGATTMWESWEDSSCNSARSRDHAFMGTVDDWLFSGVAGIQPTSPGFQTVQIKPAYPTGSLTSASAYQVTPFGRVSSSWASSGSQYRLTVKIPVGSQATVFVPAVSAQSVTESGQPAAQATGVHVIGMQGGYLQLQAGSGTYKFESSTS